jgi:hypothetical protein
MAEAVIPILVFERARSRGSPYIIQGFSPTGRGRFKLAVEGLVSLKEEDDRPPARLAHCSWQEMSLILGSSRQPSSRTYQVMRRCVRDAE